MTRTVPLPLLHLVKRGYNTQWDRLRQGYYQVFIPRINDAIDKGVHHPLSPAIKLGICHLKKKERNFIVKRIPRVCQSVLNPRILGGMPIMCFQ